MDSDKIIAWNDCSSKVQSMYVNNGATKVFFFFVFDRSFRLRRRHVSFKITNSAGRVGGTDLYVSKKFILEVA